MHTFETWEQYWRSVDDGDSRKSAILASRLRMEHDTTCVDREFLPGIPAQAVDTAQRKSTSGHTHALREHERKKIVTDYQAGRSISSLMVELGRGHTTIQGVLVKAGVRLRTRQETHELRTGTANATQP